MGNSAREMLAFGFFPQAQRTARDTVSCVNAWLARSRRDLRPLARTVQWIALDLSMPSTSTAYRLLAVALFAISAAAAQAAEAAKSGDAKLTASATKEKGKKGATSADLKKLIDQLSTQRDTLIADHDALVKQMKDATDEQKKLIIERIERQKKAFEEVTNALHKQIRDEQRKQRADAGKR